MGTQKSGAAFQLAQNPHVLTTWNYKKKYAFACSQKCLSLVETSSTKFLQFSIFLQKPVCHMAPIHVGCHGWVYLGIYLSQKLRKTYFMSWRANKLLVSTPMAQLYSSNARISSTNKSGNYSTPNKFQFHWFQLGSGHILKFFPIGVTTF